MIPHVRTGEGSYPYVRHDQAGRAPHIVPVRPVQAVGLHVWNYVAWKQGYADRDRLGS